MLSHSFITTPIFLSPNASSVSSSRSPSRKYVPPLAVSATADQKRVPPIGDYLSTPAMGPGTASSASLYEVLGVPVEATSQEIKAAYRRLARVYHPDVVAVDRKDSSAGDFMRIHAAYCTLSDPNKRAVYDGQLLRRWRRPLTAIGSADSGYRGRNWETDQCW